MTRNLSPELIRRIDAIDGCNGRWIVDCRAIEGGYSYALRDLQESCLYSSLLVPVGDEHHCWARYRLETLGLERGNTPTAEDAALYCAHTGWKAKLLWCSTYLNDDCCWPGGYDAPSIYRSNARVFRDEFSKELAAGADGDADGQSLDIRYITDEILETLAALESYPLMSDDDHSQLEMELQDEAWQDWAKSDWRNAVEKALKEYAPETATDYWADETLVAVPDLDAKLAELFHACLEETGEYWFEDGTSQYIRISSVAEAIDRSDLAELTGLPLLATDQQWRTEPYPWADGSADPLMPALV